MAKLNSATVAGGGVEILSALVTGAAANTDIAVTGYKPHRGAQVIACADLTDGTDLQADVKNGSASDKVQLTVDTTAKKLLLIWTQRA